MVKKYAPFPLVFFFLIACAGFSEDVKVTAEIDAYQTANRPIQGTVTITREKKDVVDPDTFTLDGKPLTATFQKDVAISPGSSLVISLYSFSLPPQAAGLHMLPEVSVVVGGKRYSSIPSTYTVDEEGANAAPPPAVPVQQAPPSPALPQQEARTAIILQLENIIEGPETLYPGQRITVGYRFIYNFSVDLTKEVLPLLQTEEFKKIGAKELKEYKRGQLNHFEARQVIEAEKRGEFFFPEGEIAGRAYQIDRFGRKNVSPVESRATSPAVTLTVRPFPEEGKPSSFHGAIGTSFTMEAALLTDSTVTVGDKITWQIQIGGEGDMSTVQVPDVCCQPGFSGFFRLSDLPPTEEATASSKTFTVEMRPLSAKIREIPSLAFSYFNPQTSAYETVKTAPIPLHVKAFSSQEAAAERPSDDQLPPEKEAVETEAIEIEGNYPLQASDLQSQLFGTYWALLVIPVAFSLIIFQQQAKQWQQMQGERVTQKRSLDYFKQAFQEDPKSAAFYQLVQKAFLLRLVERGDIETDAISPDFLPSEYAPGKVKALMRDIEEARFASTTSEVSEELLAEIRRVFHEIDPEKRKSS